MLRIAIWLLIFIYFIFCLLGCALNQPNGYNQYVEIISGPYRGERGMLVGDCSMFENYKIRIDDNRFVCARPWQLEKVW